MLGTLSQQRYEITADQASADVIVVNTCGFIDSAKEESVDTILEMARLKGRGALPEVGLLQGVWPKDTARTYRERFPKSISYSARTNWEAFSKL